MNGKTVRALATTLLLGSALLGTAAVSLTLAATPAAAAEKFTNKEAGKSLQEAQQLAGQKNWSGALAKARQAAGVSGLTNYERSVLDQFIVYVAVSGRDYDVALSTYDTMIQRGEIDRATGLRKAMQIALSAKKTDKALDYGKQLGDGLNPQDRLYLAQAYYAAGNFREAIRMAEPLARGDAPNKDTLELIRSSYYKLGDDQGRQKVLRQLAISYPSPEYWHELAVVAGKGPQLSDHDKLEIYRFRRSAGDLKTADDYTQMAQLAILLELPMEAKSILDEAMKANLLQGERSQRLITMTNTLTTQEPAKIAQLEKTAASAADGNGEVRLAEIYWTYGRYADAEKAIELAMQKGKLSDPATAKLIEGHIQFSQGKRPDAVKAYNGVINDPRAAGVGDLWALYARRPS
jgi:tetratricopeptide (TPR) repeat protein